MGPFFFLHVTNGVKRLVTLKK